MKAFAIIGLALCQAATWVNDPRCPASLPSTGDSCKGDEQCNYDNCFWVQCDAIGCRSAGGGPKHFCNCAGGKFSCRTPPCPPSGTVPTPQPSPRLIIDCLDKLGTLSVPTPLWATVGASHLSCVDYVAKVQPDCSGTTLSSDNKEVVLKDFCCYTCAPIVAGGAGDPHFCTLDGVCYTFNGIGTYTFVKGDGFEIQVGTHAVDRHTAAISSLGVRVSGVSDLIIEWAGESSQHVKFLVDGEVQDPRAIRGMSVKHSRFLEGGQYVLGWPSLPGLQLKINYVHRSSFALALPSVYRGQVSGLGGNGDGVASWDELVCEEGSSLSANSSMAEIHRVIEKCWKVSGDNAIMEDSEGFVEYEPKFLAPFSTEAARQAAGSVCEGNQFCMYDAAVTGNLKYAKLTKMDIERIRGSKLAF